MKVRVLPLVQLVKQLKLDEMKIVVNVPFEVTEKKYKLLMDKCSGIVAGREYNGKFYLKVMLNTYMSHVKYFMLLP